MPIKNATTSVLPDEVAKFNALADQWWDPRGPMRPLHQMNPLRTGWIATHLAAGGLAGTTLLDIGCGAGLVAEPLAQSGYEVLGLDAAEDAIAIARLHAPAGLSLSYQVGSAEDLAATGITFGAITALEVIEHVADPLAFIGTLARLLRPGGMLFVSTLNRTPAAFATAKLGAEYVLRLLPVGTHAWRQFVTPAELGAYCRATGLALSDVAGMRPSLGGRWQTVRSLSVNYIACATAPLLRA